MKFLIKNAPWIVISKCFFLTMNVVTGQDLERLSLTIQFD